ncbi:MAG: hypothetical protein ACREPT_09945 [Rudaea sp.]
MRSIILVSAAIAALLAAAPACLADEARPSPVATAVLRVSGEDGKAQTLDLAALAKLPQQTVHGQAHGKTVTCSGPNVIDVLGAIGVAGGESLRGKNLALYVRASAADGYRAVFALAELDPDLRSDVPIVTARCDGKTLDVKDGPLRLIVPGEKRPARWVRQLTALDVLRAP